MNTFPPHILENVGQSEGHFYRRLLKFINNGQKQFINSNILLKVLFIQPIQFLIKVYPIGFGN